MESSSRSPHSVHLWQICYSFQEQPRKYVFPSPHLAIQNSYTNLTHLFYCSPKLSASNYVTAMPQTACLLISNAVCSDYHLPTHTCPNFCFVFSRQTDLMTPAHRFQPPIPYEITFHISLYVLLFLCGSQYKILVKTTDPGARCPSLPLMCPLGDYLTSPGLGFPTNKEKNVVQSVPHSNIMIKWVNTKKVLWPMHNT